jgi:plasmid stability protein
MTNQAKTALSKQVTVRNVSPALSERLERLALERGQSVNATVLDILSAAVGLQPEERRARLARYTTWTEGDLQEFQSALHAQRVIDDKLWS